MGNKTSVTLSIVLDLKDDAQAKAGEPLTGKVVALVRGTVPEGQLTLSASGKELTSVHRHSHSSTSTKRRGSRRSERQFFAVNLILFDANNKRKLKAGNYEFPFSILLPTCLPTTTAFHPAGSKTGFRIAYTMEVRVQKFHIERSFAVQSAPLTPDRVPCLVRPTTHEVRQMGLIKKGSATLAASVDDTHVGRGGVLEVALACRNDTTVDIHRVQVKVVELLHWKTGHDDGDEERSATEKRVLLELNNVDLPGLLKGRRDWSHVRSSIKNNNFSREHQEMYEDLQSGQNVIRLNIPRGARDTYQGQLVHISHYIKIKLVTNSLTDCPFAKIPLKIGLPAISVTRPPAPAPALANNETTPAFTGVAVPPMNPEWQPPTPNNNIQVEPEAVPQEHHVSNGGDESCYDIPMVDAVLVNEDGTFVLANPVHASPEEIVIGGSARILVDSSEEDEIDVNGLTPVEAPELTPLPPPTAPCLPRLLEDIAASVNDYELISRRLRDPHWKPVFASLTSDEFGAIIRTVNVEFDQPRIAELLAPHVNGGSNFRCEYAASAVRNTTEWNRATMAQRLLPFCIDVSVNHHVIESELHEWDRVITRQDFEVAIASSQ